ncbi:unnamed protein product [Rotaria magnacalcarata]|uniref:Poly [ADP-ribose] polymerase n=1 Tax=Rotaria magnacalcarata TaxID=392030 RepID=A0A819RYP3_9BILA|nr:unnamed protein product [Rotaria magnacalcarata]CAF4052992.1 unnamed protein product [Rotaria magnacalcarata]
MDELLKELFEACRNGDLIKVKKLITPENINAQDILGRKSTPLHFSSGFGRRDVVEYLLSQNANVHMKDDGGLIPLHNAASFGHAEVVQLLLNHHSNVNALDSWNYSPLAEAASKGKVDVCHILLQHGADPNLKNSDGKSALDLADSSTRPVLTGEYRKDELLEAARAGNEEKLLSLLTLANVNCHASDGRKSTPLHLAAGYNRLAICKILLERGADVSCKDKGGLVPLHNAASYGHCEVAELLIQHGAQINASDLWQYTPIHEAASKSRVDVCTLLLTHGADLTLTNCHGKTALDIAASRELRDRILYEHNGYSLLNAVQQGDLHRIKKFLTNETINFQHFKTGDSPLHVACTLSSTKHRRQIFEMLLRRGALINVLNTTQIAPIHLCAAADHSDILDMLLKHNADINLLDGQGQTALHHAAKNGHTNACRFLITHRIDTRILSSCGQTALDLASSSIVQQLLMTYENEKVILTPNVTDLQLQLLEASKSGDVDVVKRVLTFNPSLVNCRDAQGRNSTPLHFAAGYNRLQVVEYLLSAGADVTARDKGGLVPLHNSCSYGHLEVTALLLKHGASPQVTDLWKVTPLHESAAKGKFEICKLLIQNGADINKKNRDGAIPLDLVKERDSDVADLLRGDNAILELAKKGNLERLRKLLTPENVNCRDPLGRNSTPLHLAAGYNHYEIAQFLLENGSNPNAVDKGGLIALHNASSFGHVDVATLLINYHSDINARDNWSYTPLHEAASKGRTQLCSLLLAHDLATADDVKSLLLDAMSIPISPTSSPGNRYRTTLSLTTRETTSILGAETNDNNPSRQRLTSASSQQHSTIQRHLSIGDGSMSLVTDEERREQALHMTMDEFLSLCQFQSSQQQESIRELFEREHITLDILAEMAHNDLKDIGIVAYGERHKLLKGIERLYKQAKDPWSNIPERGSVFIELDANDREYRLVEDELQSTIREHKDNCGGIFTRYIVLKIEKIRNRRLWDRYCHRRNEIQEDNNGHENERLLFHGSPFLHSIMHKGFDERHASITGMFGAGIYFAENSSKSNQYIYGIGGGNGCALHTNKSCYLCSRQMLLCRVCLGRSFLQFSASKLAHAPPGHHSVIGRPTQGGLAYPEYVIYRGEQAYPEYCITYNLLNPVNNDNE